MNPLVTATLNNTVGSKLLRALLDEVQTLREPWAKTPEVDQQRVIDRLRTGVEVALANACVTIAANGNVRFGAKLEGFAVKDGIQCKLSLTEANHDLEKLFERVGGGAVLVLVDFKQYVEGMESVKADKDQPDLPIGEPQVAQTAGVEL